MSESFEDALAILQAYLMDHKWGGRMANRLKTAHEHELEQARDPQRIGGTLERGSFEYAIEQLREFRWQHATNDEDAIPYINNVARAHEQARKAEYARGYEDGRRSKDADHAAVALRLSNLRFDGGSHENLSKIAYAIYPCATGWTCESSKGLRDRLIDLLGGVHEHRCYPERDCACGDSRARGVGEPTEAITYDELQAKLEEAEWERDQLRRSLRQIAEQAGVPHDRDLSEYGDGKIANAVIGQLGQTNQYVKSLEWVRDKRLPRIEAERDELKAKLDAIREALDG